MAKMFNYEADQIHDLVHPDLLTDTTHYVAECKDIILNEVTPNYPKLTEYEKEWLYFGEHVYQSGEPVNLEYQTLEFEQFATIHNAIPFHYKSAILKGNTLVNISPLNGEITLAPASVQYIDSPFIKNNTTFTISFNCSSVPTTGFIEFRQLFENTALKIENKPVVQGYNRFKVTTVSSEINRFRLKNDSTSETDFIFNNLMILEGDYTNVDVPYFEGMKSVQMPVLTTIGKNLFDVDYVVTDMSLMSIERVKDGVRLKANESYIYRYAYSRDFKVESGKYYNITYTVENENPNNVANVTLKKITGGDFPGLSDCSITGSGTVTRTFLAEDSGYVRPRLYASMTTDNGDYYVTYTNVMISEASSSNDVNVEHEPYKSNILTVNEPVELRGIGDVKDELNLITGELTQRVGEIVLDGSENWTSTAQFSDGYIYQYIFTTKSVDIIADKLKNTQLWNNISGEGIQVNDTLRHIQIKKANITTSGDFKIWLSQNPITVQYQLTTESIKTVDLSTTIKPYEGTNHYMVTSDTIPPQLQLSVPVESTGAQTLNDISQGD